MRKMLRRGRLPAYINLIEYMLDRRMARSKREAKEMILAKRVKVDSHPLGVKQHKALKKGAAASVALGLRDPKESDFEVVDYVDPIVPAELRGRIQVVNA